MHYSHRTGECGWVCAVISCFRISPLFLVQYQIAFSSGLASVGEAFCVEAWMGLDYLSIVLHVSSGVEAKAYSSFDGLHYSPLWM